MRDTLADDIDRAQDRETLYREQALTAHTLGRLLGTRPAAEQDGVCVDCGEAIGAQRLTAQPLTSRCIDCQREFETASGEW